ncbi:MAG TPA: hypothetical protein VNN08_13660 [Thermoanaerobaculia bacterium]|nr:hypothetical protein [Thermoanaerobaculia bacterium]
MDALGNPTARPLSDVTATPFRVAVNKLGVAANKSGVDVNKF